MNYSDLRRLIDQKTIKLIKNENWDEILHILQRCPEQIYFFRLILEEKIKVSKELNEFPVEKIIYENNSQDDPKAPIVHYKFTKIFHLIFELLNFKRDFLSEEFKYELCEILYPKITEFLNDKRSRISSIEKFINNLYVGIRHNYYDDFINHLFLLEYLNKERPEDIVELFPKIVSKGLYRLGYELIIKFNELIKQYDSETRQILENIILYEKQYYSLRELLEEENKELIKIMEDNRRKLRKEFYERFINYTRETLDLESFERNPEDTFRYTFDLYSKSELKAIIEKIIELKIDYSHYGNRTEHPWVHLILLDIAWAKESQLFEGYLEDLIRLGHIQAVRMYYGQFPDKIKKSQDFIFDRLGFFVLDLFRWHYEAFEFKDPEKIFRKLLFKDLPADALTLIFFNKQPELINQLKKIIKEYINAKLKEDVIGRGLFFKIDGLLRIYYRDYPEYDHKSESNISLLERAYKYFVSKSIFKEDISFIYNFKLAKDFNQLEKSLQEDIINQLIGTKNLSSIEFLLTFGYRHLESYLDLIITFKPKHDLQSEHFIKVLESILRKSGKNKEIQDKVKNRLKDQVLSHKKAEAYSFLGEFKLSEQVIEQILRDEVIIPYAINSFIDYRLVQIESRIINSSQFDISESIDELTEIEIDFKRFNSNPNLIQNYNFKLNSYKARLNLYQGFHYLYDKYFKISRNAFKEALKLYKKLEKAKRIKPDTKEIFNILKKVSNFFFIYYSRIKILLKKDDLEELNSIIKRNLIEPLLFMKTINPQFHRFLENIKNLQFDLESRTINQLKCEIPTKFCPIPPSIQNKRILDKNKEKVLIEWDKDNKTKNLEPIQISDSFEQYYFEMNFVEKDKYYDFNIMPKNEEDFQIEIKKEEPQQAGKICFKFEISFPQIEGLKYLRLDIRENDICEYKIEIPIPFLLKSPFIGQSMNLTDDYIRVLHISDIQEGYFGIKEDLKKEDPENWQNKYNLLLNDLKNQFKKIHSERPVDIIVISGDLASKGIEDDYSNLTREFIPIMEEVFFLGNNPVPKNNWLLAPGNHDVHRGKNDDRFNEYISFCQQNGFHLRFELNNPFSIFDLISVTNESNNIKIEFLLCNSCLDIYDKDTGNQAKLSKDYFYHFEDNLDLHTLKILICHHRLIEISSNKRDHCLQELRDRNVLLALVGDFHESTKYVDKINGIKFISTGALLAKKSERMAGTDVINREFNVYDINLKERNIIWSTYIKSNRWEKIQRDEVNIFTD